MAYIKYNPNPGYKSRVGDCSVRAVSKVFGTDWNTAYVKLCDMGLKMHDMPDSNNVIGALLTTHGFEKFSLPDLCPNCYSIKTFCKDYPEGVFVVGTGSHVVAVIDGNYFDSWNSGDEVPIYAWELMI